MAEECDPRQGRGPGKHQWQQDPPGSEQGKHADIAPGYVFLASADGGFYSGEVLHPTGQATSR